MCSNFLVDFSCLVICTWQRDNGFVFQEPLICLQGPSMHTSEVEHICWAPLHSPSTSAGCVWSHEVPDSLPSLFWVPITAQSVRWTGGTPDYNPGKDDHLHRSQRPRRQPKGACYFFSHLSVLKFIICFWIPWNLQNYHLVDFQFLFIRKTHHLEKQDWISVSNNSKAQNMSHPPGTFSRPGHNEPAWKKILSWYKLKNVRQRCKTLFQNKDSDVKLMGEEDWL